MDTDKDKKRIFPKFERIDYVGFTLIGATIILQLYMIAEKLLG